MILLKYFQNFTRIYILFKAKRTFLDAIKCLECFRLIYWANSNNAFQFEEISKQRMFLSVITEYELNSTLNLKSKKIK